MKHQNLFFRTWAVVGMVALLLAGGVTTAMALGTPAGTTITTKARVDYKAASTSTDRTISSAEVTLTVAYKVVIDITGSLTVTAPTDGKTIDVPFTLTNNGNATDDFSLSVTGGTRPTAGVLGWSVAFVKTSDNSPASTVNLTSGQSVGLTAKVTIPFDAVNTTTVDGQSYTLVVNAASLKNAAGAGYVIVGEHLVSTPFTATVPIAKPVIGLSYTSAPAAPTTMKPGEVLTYTLTVHNTGSVAASALSVDWAYVTSLFSSVTPAAAAGLANWSIASIGANSTSTLTFTATIDPTLNAGTYTVGDANSKVQYSDGTAPRTWTYAGGPASFTVIGVFGFSIALDPATTDFTVEPGATKQYTLLVKNQGNSTDGFSIANANGIGDDLAGATYGFDATSVASVLPGATKTILFTVGAPADAIDKKVSVQTITVSKSSVGGAAPAGAPSPVLSNLTTTVNAALLSITLGATNLDNGARLANPEPGDKIEYEVTIKNEGSKPASSVASQNTSPFPYSDITMSAVDIDADGDGTYELIGQTDGATFNGTGKVENSGGYVKVTFPPIPKNVTVKYKYTITLTK